MTQELFLTPTQGRGQDDAENWQKSRFSFLKIFTSIFLGHKVFPMLVEICMGPSTSTRVIILFHHFPSATALFQSGAEITISPQFLLFFCSEKTKNPASRSISTKKIFTVKLKIYDLKSDGTGQDQCQK